MKTMSMMAPQYDPETWHACLDHDSMTCTLNANCYSYALNAPAYHWAVPGYGFAKYAAGEYHVRFREFFRDYSVAEVRKMLIDGAIHDGLLPVGALQVRDGYYLAALVFAPDNSTDFHWYRQDVSGIWSHKNGWQAASNKDDDGVIITDPRAAARRDYPVFASYFLVPLSGIHIAKTFPYVY